ncbi:MAG: hypothetical protein FWE23_06240 [Chitinivibrionia bacterium]|nr:hypothetical protein [Chitinivibrionia bacterium]
MEKENVVIANPIYDAVFKRLMENNKIAKFLVGTILDCKVISLKATIQEHTDPNKKSGALTLYRKDFSAEIQDKNGNKKTVIIEIQKAGNFGDIPRFRDYLAVEYARTGYPIIAIYILGFNLSVNSPAFVAFPEYKDLQTNQNLTVNDNFVEHLTHKAYFVQTKRIKQSLNTKLDAVLSIFAQENFASSDKTTKSFPAEQNIPEIQELLTVLQHVAADEKVRKELEKELYYQRYLEQTYGEKDKKIAEQAEEIADKEAEIADKEAEIADKEAEIANQAEEIARLRAELQAKLGKEKP